MSTLPTRTATSKLSQARRPQNDERLRGSEEERSQRRSHPKTYPLRARHSGFPSRKTAGNIMPPALRYGLRMASDLASSSSSDPHQNGGEKGGKKKRRLKNTATYSQVCSKGAIHTGLGNSGGRADIGTGAAINAAKKILAISGGHPQYGPQSANRDS